MRIGFAESIHNEVVHDGYDAFEPLLPLDPAAPTVLLMEGMDRVAKTNPDKVWRAIKIYAAILATAITSFVLWKFVQSKRGQI